ncbi:hypothetical protein B0H10DRAFT_2233657 [Mycena sp. CBHHK59/15]|nr:hypothetical protein B0H10DRAFT_2233657 [Mycena sp. CBHHK59/15]
MLSSHFSRFVARDPSYDLSILKISCGWPSTYSDNGQIQHCDFVDSRPGTWRSGLSRRNSESKSTPSATWDSGEDAGKRGVEEGCVGATCLEVSKAYNFTACGASMYDMAAVNAFHRAPLPDKRIAYQSCSSFKTTQLVSAAAQTYANNATFNSCLTTTTTTTPRFVTWFGTFTTAHHITIPSHVLGLHHDNTYAYVYPDEFRAIYLCGVFWEVSTTGTNSHRRQDYAGRRSWWGTWGGLDDECTA